MKRIVLGLLASLLFVSQAFAASAYISEYSSIGIAVGSTPPQVAALPAIANQKVDFSAGVASAAAFNSQTKFIRIHCDAACSFTVGATATTSSARMPTDGIEYFGVQPGAVLSVIANP